MTRRLLIAIGGAVPLIVAISEIILYTIGYFSDENSRSLAIIIIIAGLVGSLVVFATAALDRSIKNDS